MTVKEAISRCVAGTSCLAIGEFAFRGSQQIERSIFHAAMYFLIGATWWYFAVKSHPQLSQSPSHLGTAASGE